MSLAGQIISAGKRPLTDLSDAPDMRETIAGMSQPMILLVTRIVPGRGGDATVTTPKTIPTQGFKSATTAQNLDIKDDGDGTRQFRYWNLYVLQDPCVRIGDKLQFDGVTYKVMKLKDRLQFGFFWCGLQEDFR